MEIIVFSAICIETKTNQNNNCKPFSISDVSNVGCEFGRKNRLGRISSNDVARTSRSQFFETDGTQ
jgi:hypothetical protein